MSISIYNQNCITGLSKIPENSIDLIITDPPYGIKGETFDKHYNRKETNVIEGYIDVPESQYAEFSKLWIKETERILKPSGSIYIISGYSNLYHILNALHSTKLTEINHLIWKYNFGVYTKKKYVSSHYHILYWCKPPISKRTFNTECRFTNKKESYKDREDVFLIPREYKPNQIKNKNELPHKLLKKLILYSSNPNDTVLDMFAGGGSTLIVANELKRNAIGFELNKNAYDLINSRIKNI